MVNCVCTLLLALVVTLAAAEVHYNLELGQNAALKGDSGQDQGSVTNCAKDKVPDLALTWAPKVLKLGESVTVSFHMTVVKDLDGGSVNVTVWLPDYPEPFFSQMVKFSCDDIHKVVKSFCPFKKGQKINIPVYKVDLLPTYPIPEGTFKIRGEIYNKQNEVFACLAATLEIKAG